MHVVYGRTGTRRSLPKNQAYLQFRTVRVWTFREKNGISDHRTYSSPQDETEARIVHRTLTELVEQQDPSLLGANLGQVRDEPIICVRVFASRY